MQTQVPSNRVQTQVPSNRVQTQVPSNTTFTNEFGLIIVSAIIFIASFLWKDLLSDLQDKLFPKNKGFLGRFFFVLIITTILVTVAVYLKNNFKLQRSIGFDDTPLGNTEDSVETFGSVKRYRNICF